MASRLNFLLEETAEPCFLKTLWVNGGRNTQVLQVLVRVEKDSSCTRRGLCAGLQVEAK